MLEYDQLELKYHRSHDSAILLAVVSHAFWKMVIIFNIARKKLWRNRVMNESNVFVVLVHVYIKITKDVQLFHIGF